MSDDRMVTYSLRLKALEEKQARCEEITSTVATTYATLQDWRRATVSGLEGFSRAWPPEVTASNTSSVIRGDEWLTLEDIANALLDYHEAWTQATAAYRLIPDEYRERVSPPPDQFG